MSSSATGRKRKGRPPSASSSEPCFFLAPPDTPFGNDPCRTSMSNLRVEPPLISCAPARIISINIDVTINGRKGVRRGEKRIRPVRLPGNMPEFQEDGHLQRALRRPQGEDLRLRLPAPAALCGGWRGIPQGAAGRKGNGQAVHRRLRPADAGEDVP